MKTVVFLLEEKSAKAFLEVILPKILPSDVQSRFITFEGKQDLEKKIERKIRDWSIPNSRFLILRDQDSDDCLEIKEQLVDKCRSAGNSPFLVRIACHELESFYLGDLQAVAKTYQITVPSQNNRKYRTPDNLSNPVQELSRITKKEYQKIDGSRRIAQELRLDGSNVSTSFNILIEGIKKLVS